MTFDHYPIEQRKKIAKWCAVVLGIVLIGVMVVVYAKPSTSGHRGFSAVISSGYTTIIERALVFFSNK